MSPSSTAGMMCYMNRTLSFLLFTLLLAPLVAIGEEAQNRTVNAATVMIVNYDSTGKFLGWGSGFFVDEGVIVTNKHVIVGNGFYRVYATDEHDAVNFDCYKKITKSDVKVNLDDDVAYMRVFLDCEHGILDFADTDPADATPVSVVGYTFRGSVEQSLTLRTTTGTVNGKTSDGWLRTDAQLDVGNSGGPVVHEDDVVGVAVAKGVDSHGGYVTSYFIPASVIYKGLIYANDSQLGYTPRGSAPTPRSSSSSSSLSSRSSTSSSSVSSSRVSSQSSSHRVVITSSKASIVRVPSDFQKRTCDRVRTWFKNDAKMIGRINERLLKRFGFECM